MSSIISQDSKTTIIIQFEEKHRIQKISNVDIPFFISVENFFFLKHLGVDIVLLKTFQRLDSDNRGGLTATQCAVLVRYRTLQSYL